MSCSLTDFASMSGNLTRCSRAHLGEGADFLSILKLQSSEFGMIRIEYKKWKHPGACFTFLSVKICSSESLDAKSAKIPLCGLGKATLTLIWAAARGERGVASEKKQMQCSALPQEFEMPAEFGNSMPIQCKYKANTNTRWGASKKINCISWVIWNASRMLEFWNSWIFTSVCVHFGEHYNFPVSLSKVFTQPKHNFVQI